MFVWIPGHIGISGNSAAMSVAKNTLDGDVSDEYVPFFELKPRLNGYTTVL